MLKIPAYCGRSTQQAGARRWRECTCGALGRGGRAPVVNLGRELDNKSPDARVDVEADARYRRADLSEVHALQARKRFAENVGRGEAGMRLAEAALLVTAEDDAIASHSTVPFPVASYLDRIQRMAEELATARLPSLLQQANATEAAQAVLGAVDAYLYQERGFSVPAWGRSKLPKGALLDHPGTWEEPAFGYLNELLVRRQGHPAAMGILHSELLQRLLQLGALEFGATIDCGGYSQRPRASLLPGLTRAAVVQADGTVLNTCTSELLAELLRFLKRAYWPCPWDSAVDDPEQGGRGSLGGFRGAAKVLLDEEVTAAMRAISVVANHRLERGIWTSPGAGDIRRALASCERLVMLVGEEQPEERRDLAVLLMHAGQLSRAKAELEAYAATPAARLQDSFDRMLVKRLLEVLHSMELDRDVQLTSVQAALDADLEQAVRGIGRKKVPLTW